MCLNRTAGENHLYKLPKFYFHQKKSRGSLKKWGYLNLVFPNAKDDGKEANKVPQKLSRHLEECQNVEKVLKTFKCAISFFLPIGTFYSQWWKKGHKSAQDIWKSAKTSKNAPKPVKYNFFWVSFNYDIKWHYLEKYRINTVKVSKWDKVSLNLH